MSLAAKSRAGKFTDGHLLRCAGRRVPQTLMLVRRLSWRMKKPGTIVSSIHYIRISHVILMHG